MHSALSRTRALLISATAIAVFVTITAVAAAATTVRVAPGPYAITPKTYWTSLKVTCPAGGEPCKGVLSLETAYAIKPYPSLPKAKARVADVGYSIAPGTTKPIKTRVYGPALAQAMRTHSVTLRISAWQPDATAPVAQRLAVFTLAHR